MEAGSRRVARGGRAIGGCKSIGGCMSSTLTAAAMGAFALGAGASDSPAQANVPPEQLAMSRRYEIVAGPLADGLNALADKNRMQIVYDLGVTVGLRTRGLVGEFTVPEALDRLLAGSSLSYRLSESRATISIRLAQTDRPEQRRRARSRCRRSTSARSGRRRTARATASRPSRRRTPMSRRSCPRERRPICRS